MKKHKITDWSITAIVERPDGTWYDHTITDFPEHIGITINEWLQDYKNFTIVVYEQQASIEYPLNEDWENLDPEHLGTHAYKIFDEKKELVYEDKTSMWDIGACLDNAQQDINCGAVQKASKQKG